MRWLTNFYDFRFKWTATAGIGIHPTKAWLSQLVNFKRAIWHFRKTICNKIVLNLEKMPCDESWIYCYDPETKRQSSQWIHAGSTRPKKARQNKSTHKLLMIPFFWKHWHDLHALGSHCTDSQQGILCWGFKGVQEEILLEETSTLQIGSVAFPPWQCTSPQPHPCHRKFDQDGHQDSSSPSQYTDIAPCDFCLFPKLKEKLRDRRYETIEEMKEAVTKVIDMLTQEEFHGAFQKLLERYNKCIAAEGDYFEGD